MNKESKKKISSTKKKYEDYYSNSVADELMSLEEELKRLKYKKRHIVSRTPKRVGFRRKIKYGYNYYIAIRGRERRDAIIQFVEKREKKARLEGTIEGIDYALCAFEGEKIKDYKNIMNYVEEYQRSCKKALLELKNS